MHIVKPSTGSLSITEWLAASPPPSPSMKTFPVMRAGLLVALALVMVPIEVESFAVAVYIVAALGLSLLLLIAFLPLLVLSYNHNHIEDSIFQLALP